MVLFLGDEELEVIYIWADFLSGSVNAVRDMHGADFGFEGEKDSTFFFIGNVKPRGTL